MQTANRLMALAALFWIIAFFYCLQLGRDLHQPPNDKDRYFDTEWKLREFCQHLRDYESKHRKFPASSNIALLTKIVEPARAWDLEKNHIDLWKLNEQGQIIDAWGTPIHISLADPMNPIAHSAGKDMVWNSPDDLYVEWDTPPGSYWNALSPVSVK